MRNTIKEVIERLAKLGITAVAAGGCARDILHGRVPKDIDICILSDAPDESIDDIEAEFGQCDVFTKYNGETDGRIRFVIKTLVNDTEVDIIQYDTYRVGTISTGERQVECFDCTLNMAWIDSTGEVQTHSQYPKPNGKVAMLKLCDFPKARLTYMSEKYPEYDWSEALGAN